MDGRPIVDEEQVDVALVVVVGADDGRRLRQAFRRPALKPCLLGNVGEGRVAIVAEESTPSTLEIVGEGGRLTIRELVEVGEVADDKVEIAIVIDKTLDLECAWGLSGRTSLRGDAPTRRAETARAVQLGKWPRKIGLTVSQYGRVWECTLQGDRFEVSGLKLPKPEDKPQSFRALLEERLDSFATFDTALMSMYRAFIEVRTSRGWDSCRAEMRNWISELGSTRKTVSLAPATV